LTTGWELSSGYASHGGVPFTVGSSTGNTSSTGEGYDRAQLVVANPSCVNIETNVNGVPGG